MSYNFTPDYIYAPDDSLEITDWRFSQDLRNFFPKLRSNHEIGKLLKQRGIINRQGSLDCEYSCTYAYFNTERAAKAFLKRLNAMPEVANYMVPPAPPKGRVAVLSMKD